MAYPVRTVATVLVAAYHSRYGKTPCPKQLEKLLFYADGHHLATTGEALFNEEIQAWEEGPVCPNAMPAYHGAKKYQPIPLVNPTAVLSRTAIASIVIAIALFGSLDADDIGEKTHTEAPYVQTWNNGAGRNNVIPEDIMKDFFRTHEIVTTPMTLLNDNYLISQGVSIERETAVLDYLKKHLHLEPFLNALIRRAQTEIAGAKQIVVELYEDPEINHPYLNVLVRKTENDSLGFELDTIWEKTVDDLKPDLRNGSVNLMTDFRPPQEAAA